VALLLEGAIRLARRCHLSRMGTAGFVDPRSTARPWTLEICATCLVRVECASTALRLLEARHRVFAVSGGVAVDHGRQRALPNVRAVVYG
jgi:hypothetical protein